MNITAIIPNSTPHLRVKKVAIKDLSIPHLVNIINKLKSWSPECSTYRQALHEKRKHFAIQYKNQKGFRVKPTLEEKLETAKKLVAKFEKDLVEAKIIAEAESIARPIAMRLQDVTLNAYVPKNSNMHRALTVSESIISRHPNIEPEVCVSEYLSDLAETFAYMKKIYVHVFNWAVDEGLMS